MLSRLAQHAAILSAYRNDERDAFPHFVPAGAELAILNAPDPVGPQSVHYFQQSLMWNIALGPGYYNDQPFQEAFVAPGLWPGKSRRTATSDYLLPCSFQAHPGFWVETTRIGPEQFGATFGSMVTWPARKVLLTTDRWAWDINDLRPPQIPVALVDGAARAVPRTGFLRGYPRGDGLWRLIAHDRDAPPAQHTIGGAGGADLP